MRLPRFTTRRLMVLVAVVAVVITLGVESSKRRRRAELYAIRESYLHADAERRAAILAEVETQLAATVPGDSARREKTQWSIDQLRIELEETRRRVKHAAVLTRAHERAARRLWEPVPPDSPLTK